MTAMNKALIKHLKSQAFSFDAHEISGKKVKESRVDTRVVKYHTLPFNLVSFYPDEPAEGEEFNAPNEVIIKGSQLGFSWRTVHEISATILIQIGDESQDQWSLKSAARVWQENQSEQVLDEILSSVREFAESTGFYQPFPATVKLNSFGSYGSFKVIAAGEKRCIQIIAKANLQEPIEFLSIDELNQAYWTYCEPLGISEYSHLKSDEEILQEIENIYHAAIESVNA